MRKLTIAVIAFSLLAMAGCIKEEVLNDDGKGGSEQQVSGDPADDPAGEPSGDPASADPPSGTSAKKGNAFVFDVQDVPKLTISVSLDEWNRLLKAYDDNINTREYIHCDATFIKDNQRYVVNDSGLRLRGQTSRRRPEGAMGQEHGKEGFRRVHFGLNFRHYHKKDKRYDLKGVHKINLKYAKEDPTYIREHYGFDFLERQGVWTSQKTSWCRLYLHVEGDENPFYMGVYLMMEAVDDEYLEERSQFRSDEGYLWKCSWGSNLRDTDDWRFGAGEKPGGQYAYELKTREDELSTAKAQLVDFIKNLRDLKGSQFEAWIKQHCDVDLLLRTYAAFVALGHWDDYWNDMNNFYLYFDSTSKDDYKVYMIPYDLDNTLGTSHNCGVQTDSGRHDPFRWGIDECIFISKLLGIGDYRLKYKEYLKAIASPGSDFLYENSVERIKDWHKLIGPYVANDTGEDCSLRDRPASWSNHQEYRLIEDSPSGNWFRVKCSVLESL